MASQILSSPNMASKNHCICLMVPSSMLSATTVPIAHPTDDEVLPSEQRPPACRNPNICRLSLDNRGPFIPVINLDAFKKKVNTIFIPAIR